MDNDNNRYMITVFDIRGGTYLVWSNDGKGFSKEKVLSLYASHLEDSRLFKPIVSKIVTITEKKIYTFDNE